jgi:hypothetical protein
MLYFYKSDVLLSAVKLASNLITNYVPRYDSKLTNSASTSAMEFFQKKTSIILFTYNPALKRGSVKSFSEFVIF